ncbi:unnamed protein product [Gadus morhua 'NCC']
MVRRAVFYLASDGTDRHRTDAHNGPKRAPAVEGDDLSRGVGTFDHTLYVESSGQALRAAGSCLWGRGGSRTHFH